MRGNWRMQMILNLAENDFLRLTGARGATVEVLDGRVWITEAGRERDAFVSSGMRYNVAGDGLVVVGKDGAAARVVVRSPLWRVLWDQAVVFLGKCASGWHEGRTISELERLSDHALRDIGLSRSDISAAVRRRFAG
jgi:uncharacterized protein YjiS (DUF1127 family)